MKNLIAFFLIIFVTGCATPRPSSHILVGQQRAAIPLGSVKIYITEPKKYEKIAIVSSTESPQITFSQQARTDSAINNLKAEAASLGANGILLIPTEDRPVNVPITTYQSTGTVTQNVTGYQKNAKGIAIYVELE